MTSGGCGAATLRDIALLIDGALSDVASGDQLIRSVSSSSEQATPDSLFVAVQGVAADGHDFIAEAFAKGAAAAVVERCEALKGRPGVVAANSRRALSTLAALYAGCPAKELLSIGVTGTNGKTTIVWLLFHLLNKVNLPALSIGTLGFAAPNITIPDTLTTPDPLLLQQCLKRGLAAGAHAAVMEVSSHALSQHRADDALFDLGIFTNLTRDHLDYHGDIESYGAAKARLFDLVAQSGKATKGAVINIDDHFGVRLTDRASSLGLNVISYGSSAAASVQIKDLSADISGSLFALIYQGNSFTIRSPLIGMHNAQNIAAVFGSGVALGLDLHQVASVIPQLPPVPGRLEPVGDERLAVYVDYAHTPDALENVLSTLRALSKRNLWVVFGCGGDRDTGKRPLMAKVATRYADKVVVTSDNPRTEDPLRIIDDILSSGVVPELVEPDRRVAVHKTLAAAADGDLVLIAGKGHEDYQIVGTIKHHFSDQEEVRKALSRRGG